MNSTDMGKRSDALFYDHINRRELCDMIANRERDLEALNDTIRTIHGAVKAGRPVDLFGYVYVRRQDGDES